MLAVSEDLDAYTAGYRLWEQVNCYGIRYVKIRQVRLAVVSHVDRLEILPVSERIPAYFFQRFRQCYLLESSITKSIVKCLQSLVQNC